MSETQPLSRNDEALIAAFNRYLEKAPSGNIYPFDAFKAGAAFAASESVPTRNAKDIDLLFKACCILSEKFGDSFPEDQPAVAAWFHEYDTHRRAMEAKGGN